MSPQAEVLPRLSDPKVSRGNLGLSTEVCRSTTSYPSIVYLPAMSGEKSQLLPGEPPPAYEDVSAPTKNATPTKPPGPLPLDLPLIHTLRSKRVILASASPRRRQLLAQVMPVTLVPTFKLTIPVDRSHPPRDPPFHPTRKPPENPLPVRIRDRDRHPESHARLLALPELPP